MIGAFRSVYRSKVCSCIVEYVVQYCDRVNQCVVCLLMLSMPSMIYWCLLKVSKLAFHYDPLVVFSAIGNTCSRVPVDSVVCL